MLLSSKFLAVISFLKAHKGIHEQCPGNFSLCHIMEKQRERGLGKFNYGNFFPIFLKFKSSGKVSWEESQNDQKLRGSKTFSQNTKDQILSAVVLFPPTTLILIILSCLNSSPGSNVFIYLEKKGDLSTFSFFFFMQNFSMIYFHFNWDLNECATVKLIPQCL